MTNDFMDRARKGVSEGTKELQDVALNAKESSHKAWEEASGGARKIGGDGSGGGSGSSGGAGAGGGILDSVGSKVHDFGGRAMESMGGLSTKVHEMSERAKDAIGIGSSGSSRGPVIGERVSGSWSDAKKDASTKADEVGGRLSGTAGGAESKTHEVGERISGSISGAGSKAQGLGERISDTVGSAGSKVREMVMGGQTKDPVDSKSKGLSERAGEVRDAAGGMVNDLSSGARDIGEKAKGAFDGGVESASSKARGASGGVKDAMYGLRDNVSPRFNDFRNKAKDEIDTFRYKNNFHDSDRSGNLKEITDEIHDGDSHGIVNHVDSEEMFSDRETKEGAPDLVGGATEMEKSRDTTGGALNKVEEVAVCTSGKAEDLANEVHNATSDSLVGEGQDQNIVEKAAKEIKNEAIQEGTRDAIGECEAKDEIIDVGVGQDSATGNKAQGDAKTSTFRKVQDATAEAPERAKDETTIEKVRDLPGGAADEEIHKVIGDSTRLSSDMAGEAMTKTEGVAEEVGEVARESRDMIREAADDGKEVCNSQDKISTSDKNLGSKEKVDSSSEKAKVYRDSQKADEHEINKNTKTSKGVEDKSSEVTSANAGLKKTTSSTKYSENSGCADRKSSQGLKGLYRGATHRLSNLWTINGLKGDRQMEPEEPQQQQQQLATSEPHKEEVENKPQNAGDASSHRSTRNFRGYITNEFGEVVSRVRRSIGCVFGGKNRDKEKKDKVMEFLHKGHGDVDVDGEQSKEHSQKAASLEPLPMVPSPALPTQENNQ